MRPKDQRQNMERLRADGLSYQQIADELGVSRDAVQYWLRPERRNEILAQEAKPGTRARKRREYRAARAALHRQRLHEDVKRVGGIAESYSLLRRCLQAADQSLAEIETPDARAELRAAIGSLHEAEDKMAAAGRLA